MRREPWFWRESSQAGRTVSLTLTPFAALYDCAQRARWRFTKPAAVSTPIICIGNATLGGVGKTPFAMALANRLADEGLAPHFLTRGYGGALEGPVRVDPNIHRFTEVGDEALLLVRVAPTWVSRNRPDGARAADNAGADLIIMDDGFQNPTIKKTVSILLFDPRQPVNARVFPAGPYREPMERAHARADVEIPILAAPPPQDPEGFAAWLEVDGSPEPTRVAAFAGIGRPGKFFAALRNSGFEIASETGFPDHHPYTARDLDALRKSAEREGAQLITTEKDYARLPQEWREEVTVLPVVMHIANVDRLISEIHAKIDRNEASL